jgi:hypothetical protein
LWKETINKSVVNKGYRNPEKSPTNGTFNAHSFISNACEPKVNNKSYGKDYPE